MGFVRKGSMKAAGLLCCVLLVGCGDSFTSSGGDIGEPVDPSVDVSGIWTGGLSANDSGSDAPAQITVELIQRNQALYGSIAAPPCFPKTPIISGRITRYGGIDAHSLGFTASDGDRSFSVIDFAFTEPSITGTCDLTTDVPGCRSTGERNPDDLTSGLCFVTLSRSG